MKRDPADAARRMGIRQQTTGEQFLEAQKGLHVPTREENLRMLGGPTPELAVSGRRLMALMVDAKLLRTGLDIEGVLAPGPLADLPKCMSAASAPGASLTHARSGDAQAHGPAHSAGLRRDARAR